MNNNEVFYAALELVEQIDHNLDKGLRHYRAKSGTLLTTLDQVVRAILDDNLLLEEQPLVEERWAQLSW